MYSENKKRLCIYCEKDIEKESKEHIIQNALGGQLVFSDICCSACNQRVRRDVDDQFTKIFNPLLGIFKNMHKTNHVKSSPKYKGKAFFKRNGKQYDVILKNGKIVDCKELKKDYKEKFKPQMLKELILLFRNFEMDNYYFKQGMSKIAFNFALYSGVDFSLLRAFLHIEPQKKDFKISFSNVVIPFIALNPFDEAWEITRKGEPYHNLILFSQDKYLWCYVDLFNTFQTYVLLSKSWDKEKTINKSYFQLLKKLNRETPEISIRRPKDAWYYAQTYNVSPVMDECKMKEEIQRVINKQSLQMDMQEYITSNFPSWYAKFTIELLQKGKMEESNFFYRSWLLYMDDDDCLRKDTYKQVTWRKGVSSDMYSYPCELCHVIEECKDQPDKLKQYGYRKMERLNQWLSEHG